MKRTGVLLLQMGGPTSLEEVEPYLVRLFSDRDLVRLPPPLSWFQGPLARFVARRRAPGVREQYRAIGGASPNNHVTVELADRLQERLAGEGDFRCFAAMTYTAPRTREALEAALEAGCRELLALPLFPHYCEASTGASFSDLERARAALGPGLPPVRRIRRWYDRPDYLDALAARVRRSLEEARAADPEAPVLVVSAHGVPEALPRRGDPYVEEVRRTVELLRPRLPQGLRIELAWQSKATPFPWVGPATDATLEALGRKGVRNVVVLPVSFVHDHLETLYEIDQLLREVALGAGVRTYRRVPLFNAEPDLVEILRNLVLEEFGRRP